MGFGQAVSTCFSKFVTFKGRARRSEYWYFYLFIILVAIAAGVLDILIAKASGTSIATTGTNTTTAGPISGLANLVLFLPSLSVTVRRLHDTGHSGWVIGGFWIYLIFAVTIFIMYIANVTSEKPDFTSPIGIIALIAMIGIGVWGIWVFVLMVLSGTHGPNRFGEDPIGG